MLSVSLSTANHWIVDAALYTARDRDVNGALTPLRLSYHAVERRMQWRREQNARQAIESMGDGILLGTGVSLGMAYPELTATKEAFARDWLLGIEGGALVCVPDGRHPGGRIITTTLRDADKWGRDTVGELKLTLPDGFDFWKAFDVQSEAQEARERKHAEIAEMIERREAEAEPELPAGFMV